MRLLVHDPLFRAIGQQVGQGLGIAIGLLNDMGDEQQRGFHQHPGLGQVRLGDLPRVVNGERRNLDLGQFPPQPGHVLALLAGAGEQLRGVQNRQPERHQRRRDRGLKSNRPKMYAKENLAALTVYEIDL